MNVEAREIPDRVWAKPCPECNGAVARPTEPTDPAPVLTFLRGEFRLAHHDCWIAMVNR